MQCRVKKQVVRRQGLVVVECFKCGKEEHKCRKCLLWERVTRVAKLQKAHQQKEPVCSVKEEAQEKGLRRVEEEKAVHMAKL